MGEPRSGERSSAARYEFLRGAEPYKYDFGARDTQSLRCSLPACAAQAAQRPQPRA
jgi:hypothetical protein